MRVLVVEATVEGMGIIHEAHDHCSISFIPPKSVPADRVPVRTSGILIDTEESRIRK